VRWWPTGRGLPPVIGANTAHAWTCDESATNASLLDLLGGGENLINKTGSPTCALGPVGNCRTLDGTMGFWGTTTGADISWVTGDSYVISVLCRVDAASGTLVEYGAVADTDPLRLRIDANRKVAFVHTGTFGTETLTSSYVCAVGEWVLIQAEIDPTVTTFDLYINGEWVEQVVGTNPAQAGASGQVWHVGLMDGGTDKLTGRLGYVWLDAENQSTAQLAETMRRAKRLGWLSDSRVRVDVEDGDNTFQDMRALAGVDWIDAVEIVDSSDQRIVTASAEFKRDHYNLSLSKWHDNKMNRFPIEGASWPGPDDTTYANPDAASPSELLELNRGFRVYTALVPMDLEPVATDWALAFDGYVDAIDWGSDPVQVRASDKGVKLQEAHIESSFTVTGAAINTMQQAILTEADTNNWLVGAAPTIWLPVSMGGLSYETVKEERRPLFEAVSGYADEVGWVLRYRWRESTSAFELKMYEPARTKSRADVSVAVDDGVTVSKLSVDKANIRTVVKVIYLNPSSTDESGQGTATPVVQEADGLDIPIDSIANYGRLYCELSDGSTLHVASAAQAAGLARAVLYDLCQPTVESALELDQARPDIEIEDALRIQADGVTATADLTCAAFSVRHRWDGSGSSTTLDLRGRPSGGGKIHLARETRTNGTPAGPTSRGDLGVPRASRNWTLVRHGVMQRSPMGGRSRRGYLSNPAFELWTWPDEEPDGWTVTTGTWGASSNVHYDTTEVKSAIRSVMFRDGNGDLSSQLFAVEEGEILGLKIKQKRQATAGSTLVVYVDTYTADRTTSAGAVTAITTTDTASWVTEQGFAAMPANARFARVRLSAGATTSKKIYVDHVETFHQALWFKGYRNGTDQTLTGSAETKIQCNAEKDPGAIYDNATNYRVTPGRVGTFRFSASARVEAASAAVCVAVLYKNGAAWKIGPWVTLAQTGGSMFPAYGGDVTIDVPVAVVAAVTDYYEFYVSHSAGGTVKLGEELTYFYGRVVEET